MHHERHVLALEIYSEKIQQRNTLCQHVVHYVTLRYSHYELLLLFPIPKYALNTSPLELVVIHVNAIDPIIFQQICLRVLYYTVQF